MKDSGLEVLARGILIRGGSDAPRILVCRSVAGGYCYLPGGHVEFDEPASSALDREFREETGLACRPGALALVMEERFEQRGRRRHEYCLVFHVEHLEGEDEGVPALDRPPIAVASREPGIAFEWIALDRLGDADLRPARLLEWLAGPMGVGADWLAS
ncbi:MAG: NUDIX domain-containing protein [Planctomycetota bacterium]